MFFMDCEVRRKSQQDLMLFSLFSISDIESINLVSYLEALLLHFCSSVLKNFAKSASIVHHLSRNYWNQGALHPRRPFLLISSERTPMQAGADQAGGVSEWAPSEPASSERAPNEPAGADRPSER